MFFLSKLEWRSTFPGEKRPRDDSERKRESEKIQEAPTMLRRIETETVGPDKHANIIDDLRMTITQRIMEADANVQHFAT